MEADELQQKLSAPFPASAVDWRLQWAEESKGGWAIPYLNNRAIQQRLDDTVGVLNWRNRFLPWHGDGGKKSGQLCGISIYFPERGEWVEKFDGADDSDIEAVKGGLSDSMKRAAVQWGLGRYLYGMEMQWVDVERKGKSLVVAAKDHSKLDRAHNDYVAKLTGAATPVSAPQRQAEKPAEKPPAKAEPKAAPTPEVNRKIYEVADVAAQPGMTGGGNLFVKLKNGEGRILDVFVVGMDPAFVRGALVTDVAISKQTTQGVVSYTLDHYEIVPPEAKAA